MIMIMDMSMFIMSKSAYYQDKERNGYLNSPTSCEYAYIMLSFHWHNMIIKCKKKELMKINMHFYKTKQNKKQKNKIYSFQ